MDALLKLILTGILLAVVAYGQNNNCPSGEDNIHATCEYGCACECGRTNATFAGCVTACEQRIGGPNGCNALAIGGGGGGVSNEKCPLTDYTENAVCARICDCCDTPTDRCSCGSTLASSVFNTACGLS